MQVGAPFASSWKADDEPLIKPCDGQPHRGSLGDVSRVEDLERFCLRGVSGKCLAFGRLLVVRSFSFRVMELTRHSRERE